jgi:hypothetical protein
LSTYFDNGGESVEIRRAWLKIGEVLMIAQVLHNFEIPVIPGMTAQT